MLADIYFLFRQVMPKGVPPKGFSSSGAHLSCRLSEIALQMQGENRIQFAYDGFGRVTSHTYSATGGESPRVTTYTYHDIGEGKTTPQKQV